ncbi:probable RNA polymerase II nuclear localization protein SLC7A6OS isoform X2 [Apteryx mantelli]|uniref:Probable RNA polymerase II nuclear localization protein SLC7A6OS n=1 Tax=Apteryx mantelli TaxID=2696672 RepID=A0ABM4F1B4_9AVES
MERAAVLRVKRKRGGPEPAEALLLACKRRRPEPGGPPGPPRLEKGLFKLVATVSSKNEPLQKYVQEGISRDKAARSLRPSSGSAQRIAQDLRSARQASRRESRYRVIASHRPAAREIETVAPVVDGKTSAGGDRSGSGARKDASEKGSSAVDESSDYCGKFQLFDIVQEEEALEDSSVTAANPQVDDDHIPGEIYEDEDDENDENNWRNDYPDEDEFLPEEDGDGEKESEESLSDEDQCFRRRTWNKYRHEVLQEFGYDEVQDLDSD